MSEPRPAWDDLNAYVDGELAPVESARIARAAAEDHAVAEEIATLARLKASLADATPEMPEIAMPPRRRPVWRRVAAAAAVVLLIGYAGARLLPGESTTSVTPDWVVQARAAHTAWIEAEANDATPTLPRAGIYLATLTRLGPRAYAPDLSAARLTISRLAYAEPIGAGRDGGIHIGYAGTRGCRVSLWVAPAPVALAPDPIRFAHARGAAYHWRSGALAYTLVASGMAEARLALIARAAIDATRRRAQPGTEMRSALRRSRDESPPCAG
jgi:anti-sigma factor RsiW